METKDINRMLKRTLSTAAALLLLTACSSSEPDWVSTTIDAKSTQAVELPQGDIKVTNNGSEHDPSAAAGIWVPTEQDEVKYLADAAADIPVMSIEDLTEEYYRPFRPGGFKVSVGDILEISIFGHRDTLSRDTPVAPDGKIYYFFTDGVPAAGRTVQEIEDDLEARLGDLFAAPEVTIIPKRITSSKFTLLGKVKGPGTYYLKAATRLRQAIGMGGGFAEGGYRGTSINIASLRRSFIVRDGKKLPIDFEELMKTEDDEHDIYVRPGDYIYIASSLIEEVYRLGAVREQRPMPYQDGLTLVGLITGQSGEGGGYLGEAGYIQQTLVIRGSLEDPQVTVVDLEAVLEGRANDVYLIPGDIVYVPYKPYRWLRRLIRTAIFSYVRAFGGAAGFFYGEELFEDND